MKLAISKSKDNSSYYTTLKNNYNNEELKTYMTVQLAKNLNVDYGVYDVDCFLSCYKTKNGEVKPKIVVTEIKGREPIKDKTQSEILKDVMTDDDPFTTYGEQIEIGDDFLD